MQQRYLDLWLQVNRGELSSAAFSVDNELRNLAGSDPLWFWRLANLKAEILVRQRRSAEALQLTDTEIPPEISDHEIRVWRFLTRAMAHCYVSNFSAAEQDLRMASANASANNTELLGEIELREGTLAFWRGDTPEASVHYREALNHARDSHDVFLESAAEGSLGLVATRLEHYDEAIDWNTRALQLSQSAGAKVSVARILGNLGWSYFELGDYEAALDLARRAANSFELAGMPGLQLDWLTNIAVAEFYLHDYGAAESQSERVIALARTLGETPVQISALNNLTRIDLALNRVDAASRHNGEALELARTSHDGRGQVTATVIAGSVCVAEGKLDQARVLLESVAGNAVAASAERWDAYAGLARVHEALHRSKEAERAYEKAIGMIEGARHSVGQDELRLSFLSSGIAVYDQYIDFLVRHGRVTDAMMQAELSRARTLEEGLSTGRRSKNFVRIDAQNIAGRLGSVVLTYWLGEKRSYLWAITTAKAELFMLPAAGEIEARVKAYRKAQADGADVLHSAVNDGQELYKALVAPAAKLISRGSRVVVLPDESLYSLNFETLIVPEPEPHFWIEDVTVSEANSLTLLAAGTRRTSETSSAGNSKAGNLMAGDSKLENAKAGNAKAGNAGGTNLKSRSSEGLLVVGDTLQASPEFPLLRQAPQEIALVEKYFPETPRLVLAKQQATPSGYLASHPEQYAYLHFVTHGIASRTRPLESAVILSPDGDSYKLYAREIVKHRLNAELVTISACNGSGTRSYSGEGLVGLSWAFLRAGAHNVIGALWEVSDTATPQLMDKLYGGIAAGQDPATALRNAKLAFLHSGNVYAKPFYWAAFQLYSGS